jgi:DNA-binding transcriptional MerR regulator
MTQIVTANNWVSTSEAARPFQIGRTLWDYYLTTGIVPPPTKAIGRRRFYTQEQLHEIAKVLGRGE